MREVARVLRPGGRWVFAVNHPMRWMFSDDPGPDGLLVTQSYFDRTPYVEVDGAGRATYVEHHRTLGDRVRDVVAAGLVLDDGWSRSGRRGRDTRLGQWSPLRGARTSRGPRSSARTGPESGRGRAAGASGLEPLPRAEPPHRSPPHRHRVRLCRSTPPPSPR
jgi:hypothetical protein